MGRSMDFPGAGVVCVCPKHGVCGDVGVVSSALETHAVLCWVLVS